MADPSDLTVLTGGNARKQDEKLYSVFHSDCFGRSETYNANEIKLMLSDEDNITMEWIEIDPEAFTGTKLPVAHYFLPSRQNKLKHSWVLFEL